MARQTLAYQLKTSLDSGRFFIPEETHAESFTLSGSDNGTRIVCTASLTITLPAVGQLKNGFECEVINDSGGPVVIDGPGVTNVTMDDADIACVCEAGGKQRVAVGPSTVIS